MIMRREEDTERVCERYREERAYRPYAMNPDESLGSEVGSERRDIEREY